MKNSISKFASLVAVASAAVLGACSEQGPIAPEPTGSNHLNRITTQRSIGEFVQAQRGYGLAWYGGNIGATAWIDYAGAIYRRSLTPEAPRPVFNGTVSEEWLPDGSARVTVDLFSDRVLSFAVDGMNVRNDAVIFGVRPVASYPKNAALGRSHLMAVFRNTAPGAPLPDLAQLVAMPQKNRMLEWVNFSADAISQNLETDKTASMHVDQPGLAPGGFIGAYGTLPAADLMIDRSASESPESVAPIAVW